jgi:transcriptional regulator
MYLPAHFKQPDGEVIRQLLREAPMATLVTLAAGILEANHLPMLLGAEEAPMRLRFHVARANPVWRESQPGAEVLAIFQGPDTYITPSWYATKAQHGKVVPTWNYVMVQARGRLRAIDDKAWLRAFVTRLTERHEGARPTPWAVSDAPADFIDATLGAIVGIEIALSSLVGKWKVSQNRSAADRAGVADGLAREAGDPALAAAGSAARRSA